MSISFRPAFQRAALSFVLTLSLSCGGGDGGGSTGPTPNPVPTLSGLVRDTITAGGTPFVLTVHGTKFTAGLTGTVDSVERTTSRLNDTTATVTLVAADVAVAGDHQVRVANPEPGGGVSGALPLHVLPAPPVPVLDSLGADTAQVGSPYTLDVYGSSFTPQSVIRSNDTTLPTGHLSSSHLSTTFYSFPGTPGSRQITVFTPAPGGGMSAVKILTVLPLPTIASTQPDTILTGTGGIPFRAIGHDFALIDSVQTVYQGGAVKTVAPNAFTDSTVDFSLDRTGLQAQDVLNIRVRTRFGTSEWRAVPIADPAPVITSVTPDTVDGTGPTDTILVTGAHFRSGMYVRIDGSYVFTQVTDSAHARAVLDQTLLMMGGSHTLDLYDSSALVASNQSTFIIKNPAPLATAMDGPPFDTVGSSERHELVGSNFRNGSLLIDGVPVTPAFLLVEPSSVDFNLTPAQTGGTDTLFVSWQNDGPGGGTTTAFPLRIVAPSPVPILDSFAPHLVSVNAPNAVVTVRGNHFIPGMIGAFQNFDGGNWTNSDSTVVLDSTTATVNIPATMISDAGRLRLRLYNPGSEPSSSSSDTLVVRTADVASITMVPGEYSMIRGDTLRHVLYAATWGTGPDGARLWVISPDTTGPIAELPIPGEITDMDLSSDDQYLYAAVQSTQQVLRFDLTTRMLDTSWTPMRAPGDSLRPLLIAASPSSPQTIAVYTGHGLSDPWHHILVYDGTIARPNASDINGYDLGRLHWANDTQVVLLELTGPSPWFVTPVDSAGADSAHYVWSSAVQASDFTVSGNVLLGNDGQMADLWTGAGIGSLSQVRLGEAAGMVPGRGHLLYLATTDHTPWIQRIHGIDLSSMTELGSASAYPDVDSYGTDKFAVLGGGYLATGGLQGLIIAKLSRLDW